MQIFVRDISGSTLSFNASTPSSLVDQVTEATGLSPSSARLSYNSKNLSSSSPDATFQDLGIHNYATLDLSLRLRGGGPKKRCAYVYAKTGTTPSTSGTATPSTSSVNPAPSTSALEASKTDQSSTATGDVDAKEGEKGSEAASISSTTPAPLEPTMERCNSAALRMVGECPRCTKNFCAAHRLPEDHACPALANFRKAAFDENRERLVKEATHTSKISAF